MSGRRALLMVLFVLAMAAVGCKKKSEDSSSSEPASTTGEGPTATEVPAPSTAAGTPVQGTPVESATNTATPSQPSQPTQPTEPVEPLEVETKDILSREPVTQAAQVKHILIGWADLSQARDPRAMQRTKEEADKLALELLDRVRKGENVEAMMAEFSEDPGSAQNGDPYPVRPESDFVPEFEALGLRLNVGEAGICRTVFGYHIMKRVQ